MKDVISFKYPRRVGEIDEKKRKNTHLRVL